MSIEMLVGVNIVDEQEYATYREKMTPILASMGGGFSNDFEVSNVLRSESGTPVSRLFTIHFPDKDVLDAFFSDDDYLAIRQQHFEPAVTDTTVIATYER